MELPIDCEYTDINEMLTEIITDNFGVPIDYIDGIVKEKGKYKDKENNQIWIIDDNNWYMFCQPNIITKICKESYNKIIEFENNHGFEDRKITWYNHKSGYISSPVCTGEIKTIMMHQVIMNYYGNGRGTGGAENNICSIDHIDRNRLNNSIANLRIATRKEQENNSKGIMEGTKRERRFDASELPDDITQKMMPKYVNYNKEVWDKENAKVRYFFRIENHPLLEGKTWESSKSTKISNQEKLDATMNVLHDLDNGILPTTKTNDIPKHVYFTKKENGKFAIVYDKRENDKSLTKRMTIKDEEFDIDNPEHKAKVLERFNRKIVHTYGEEYAIFDEDEESNRSEVEEDEYELPKYVCATTDHDLPILLYCKRVKEDETINKKVKLDTPFNVLTKSQKDDALRKLNFELVKKYDISFAFQKLNEDEIKSINSEIELPLCVRIAPSVQDGSPYIFFDKKIEKQRYSKSMKLPKNYNINKELVNFHTILKEFGPQYTFEFPKNFKVVENEYTLPENVYINDQCDNPYIFEIQKENSVTMKLPEFYKISDIIEQFVDFAEKTIEQKLTADEQKGHNNLKNVSITKKGKYMTLCYQLRNNQMKMSEYITLPNEAFDYNIQLVRLNHKIIEKHGSKYSFLIVS